MLTAERARELFSYNKDTGVLTWRPRPRNYFATENSFLAWNSRCAGREAGGVIKRRGWRQVVVEYEKYAVHRVIWLMETGEWPEQIDHIDGARGNNRWANLRDVSHQENMRNKRLFESNKSGLPGVWWDGRRSKWRAYVGVNGRNKTLGEYNSFGAAARARAEAAAKLGFHENHGRSVSM